MIISLIHYSERSIMLIKCPECELQVSDKAISCPHCGYILDVAVKKRVKQSHKKHRRLPNGFGQITEIKNRNLRNPFRAMVTVGKTSTGKPIAKPLKPVSFFPTYNDAYAALVEYNRNPYDLCEDITVEQLYERWSDWYFESLKGASSTRTITSAWRYCSSVYTMRVKDLRARHIKGCMEDGIFVYKGEERHPSPNTKSRIKSLFNLMLDYALEYELVDKNYARTFDLSDDVIKDIEEQKIPHIKFTDEEINKLWENVDEVQYADVVLIQCYGGWRPQELVLIELKNVFLDEGYCIGGIKSDAGVNRIVPIHPKIRHLIKRKYQEAIELNSDYLINCTDTNTHRSSLKFTYDKYQVRFKKVMDRLELNPDHRAHDPRKHFVSLAKKMKMDEYALKYIVGHKINDITEKVYTERDIEWLIEEMLKIE